ncbi:MULTISPECIES: OmpA family protein [Prochlorococcus]|nr:MULTISPECIES: OmpA family protein [Prochlorococcus]KZR65483.1 Photosystem I P700 chlorophyll a apoprotein A2 [Prochlorococcus sp. MIT 1306]
MNKTNLQHTNNIKWAFNTLLLVSFLLPHYLRANQDNRGTELIDQGAKEIDLIQRPIEHKFSILDLDYQIQGLDYSMKDLTYSINDLNITTKQENEVLIELAADVLFDFDKANLKPSAVASLETVAKRIRETSQGDVRVEGHTDSKGSNEYNQTLSEKRAISVRDWFVSDGGLSNVQFVTKGFGELKPVVSNTTEKGGDNPIGRQRNRRVEIIIKTVD